MIATVPLKILLEIALLFSLFRACYYASHRPQKSGEKKEL